MARKQTEKQAARKEKATLGLGLAAAFLGGAAYYFFGSKRGARHRKEAKSWPRRFETEAEELLFSLRHEGFTTIENALENLAREYRTLAEVDHGELEKIVESIKGVWKGRLSEITWK